MGCIIIIEKMKAKKGGIHMISKKSADLLNVVRNVYEIVEERKGAGYDGDMRQLIQEAIRKTAMEDAKNYNTVESNITRGMDLLANGAMDEICQMIEDACMGENADHSLDKLLKTLLDTRNGKDSEAFLRSEYQDLFSKK